jgi:mono/diheme cytochrome c family protein
MHRRILTVVVTVILSTLAASAIVGCANSGTSGGSSSSGGMMGSGGSSSTSGGGMMGGGSGAGSYASVGERIYLTGVGTDGRDISRTAPRVAQGALMMGGGGCGSCHGADGRGGTIEMMTGTAIKAPDITYDALIGVGFTGATVRRAIRDGLDESGKALADAMPRWQMSDGDLDATIAYLKELSAR